MLLCVTLLSAVVDAEEPSEDLWFAVSAVGFHYHGKPDVVALEQEGGAIHVMRPRRY